MAEAAAATITTVFSFLALFALLFSPPQAWASDPSQLQDFCVALKNNNNQSGVFVNGKFCMDPQGAKPEDFFFRGLNVAGNTSASPQGSAVTPVNVDNLAGLNTLGISLARIDIAEGGVVSPHLHPRATEIVTVQNGSIYVGFITTNPPNRLFAKLLMAGDVFVFPQGVIHFLQNVGKHGCAVAISALSSQNPGTTLIPNAVFGSDGRIPDAVLTKAFQVDQNVISQLEKPFTST